MGTIQDYKNRAIASLEGNWGKGALATLIVFLISGLLGNAFSAPFSDNQVTSNGITGLWTMLCFPLSWGATVFFLSIIRKENPRYENLFDGYKDFIRIFLAMFLVSLAVLVGILLLIVPGIILGLMFSQTEYILKDEPQTSAIDAMMKSAAMMKGHKVDLFILTLSFIGWFLLCILTLGLGFFLLAPYYNTTMAHYYEDLKAEYIKD